jgi:hypothetical protein
MNPVSCSHLNIQMRAAQTSQDLLAALLEASMLMTGTSAKRSWRESACYSCSSSLRKISSIMAMLVQFKFILIFLYSSCAT